MVFLALDPDHPVPDGPPGQPDPATVLHRLELLLGLVVAQGALGYYQYFNGVPRLAVGFHVAGATAVFSAAVVVLCSDVRAGRGRPGLDEPAESGAEDLVSAGRSPGPDPGATVPAAAQPDADGHGGR